jgi:hypothetical protein
MEQPAKETSQYSRGGKTLRILAELGVAYVVLFIFGMTICQGSFDEGSSVSQFSVSRSSLWCMSLPGSSLFLEECTLRQTISDASSSSVSSDSSLL